MHDHPLADLNCKNSSTTSVHSKISNQHDAQSLGPAPEEDDDSQSQGSDMDSLDMQNQSEAGISDQESYDFTQLVKFFHGVNLHSADHSQDDADCDVHDVQRYHDLVLSVLILLNSFTVAVELVRFGVEILDRLV